jgi:hypothetical protein
MFTGNPIINYSIEGHKIKRKRVEMKGAFFDTCSTEAKKINPGKDQG